MKTYSKDDVINAIRDLLQNVTEVESIEHAGGSEFVIRIITGKEEREIHGKFTCAAR